MYNLSVFLKTRQNIQFIQSPHEPHYEINYTCSVMPGFQTLERYHVMTTLPLLVVFHQLASTCHDLHPVLENHQLLIDCSIL